MKRLLMVMAVLFGLSGVSYADNIGMESVLNNVYNTTTKTLNTATGIKRGTLTKVRSSVIVDDTVKPALGSGLDLSGYSKALIFVSADSTATAAPPSWVITPLYGEPSLWKYFAGSPTTVVSQDALVIDTFGTTDLYIYISNGNSAAGQVCNVWIQGVN